MNKLLTPAELAALLGLATQTIYNRHSAGASLPPCVRMGRMLRFRVADVEAWIAAQAEQPLLRPPASPPCCAGRPTKAEEIACHRGGAL